MNRRWDEQSAVSLLRAKGVDFVGNKMLISKPNLGNGGGGAFDYLKKHCGYSVARKPLREY